MISANKLYLKRTQTKYDGVKMFSYDNVLAVIRDIIKPDKYAQEATFVVSLNGNLEITDITNISIGSKSNAIIDISHIFASAILSNARFIFLVHNHPAGSLVPSIDDIKVYEEISKAGNLLKIEVFDSLIINGTQYYSIEKQKQETYSDVIDIRENIYEEKQFEENSIMIRKYFYDKGINLTTNQVLDIMGYYISNKNITIPISKTLDDAYDKIKKD